MSKGTDLAPTDTQIVLPSVISIPAWSAETREYTITLERPSDQWSVVMAGYHLFAIILTGDGRIRVSKDILSSYLRYISDLRHDGNFYKSQHEFWFTTMPHLSSVFNPAMCHQMFTSGQPSPIWRILAESSVLPLKADNAFEESLVAMLAPIAGVSDDLATFRHLKMFYYLSALRTSLARIQNGEESWQTIDPLLGKLRDMINMIIKTLTGTRRSSLAGVKSLGMIPSLPPSLNERKLIA